MPAPGPGEVRIRQHAVGLNFIDVYFRTGLYKAPGLPFIAGNEAAGEVVAVGSGRHQFSPRRSRRLLFHARRLRQRAGDPGGQAGQAARPHHLRAGRRPDAQGADGLVPAAQDLQGRARPPRADPCRRGRHRAAGLPVGEGARRACDRHRGLKAKADLALPMAATTSSSTTRKILSRGSNRSAATNSAMSSMTASARPRSRARCRACGPRPVREFWQRLRPGAAVRARRSSTTTARCLRRGRSSTTTSATRKELLEGADTLFAAVINGKLHVPINHAYALKDAAKAHTELESRATTGAAILRP